MIDIYAPGVTPKRAASAGLLPDAMRDVTRRLQSSLGSSGGLADSLTKGEIREDEVIGAFRPHIARRYDLAKGIVVDSAGTQSDPQDVVIQDGGVLPALYGGDGHNRVFPVESVVGVIQVKSIASATAIRSAVRNVGSAKLLLPRGERYGQPHGGAHEPGLWAQDMSFFGGLLFLSSESKNVDGLVNVYNEANIELEPRNRCDALCIIGDVAVVWGSPSRHGQNHLTFSPDPQVADAPLILKAGADSLLFFYAILVDHLRNWISPPMSWVSYAFGPEEARNPLSFEFEYWYSDPDHPPDWAIADESPASDDSKD
jgi:hypothetical protein